MNPSSSEIVITSKQSQKMSDIQAFLTNLPPEVIIDILSRLPIPTIVTCKCVCRKFLELISSSAFAEFHLSKPGPGLIVYQILEGQEFWRIFEFEDGLELQHHDLHYNKVMDFDPRTIIATPHAPHTHASILMEGGSVNGLLCLHDYNSSQDALYICNPMTRECIALPRINEKVQYPDMVTYGFGVSSSSNQYKLLRISQRATISTGPSSRNIQDLECLIYTLGTGSWRSIAPGVTFEMNPYPGNAFLNGSLHWLVGDAESSSFIACFDLETESFKPFPGHPFPSFFYIKGSLVVLGDCLCFSDCSSDEEIVIWVMKEYGVGESWTKQHVISKSIGDLGGLSYEAVIPLKLFKDGDLLFLWQNGGLFYYSSKTETAPEVDLFSLNRYDEVEPMLHTPTFLSLKRFEGENVTFF